VLLLNALFMFLAALISLLQGGNAAFSLLLSAAITGVAGAFPLIFVQPASDITMKEGTAILILSWFSCCVFGMLPYLLWGGDFTLINAWFESVSGYSTTGATILKEVERLPKGILFWRSSTHWIGGLGVVLMLVLVLPTMRSMKLRLAKTEISSLSQGNYKFRVQQTARVICLMFAILTAVLAVALMLAGMNWFDAVNHAFSTIATGGFSTRDASIFAFHNVWIEIILAVFMLIAGMHFGLLYMAFTGNPKPLWRSPVVRFYLCSLLLGSLLVSLNLWLNGTYAHFSQALRYGAFQVIAVSTTTGFATADTVVWPSFSVLILLYFMFQCACAGSTSGGIKVDRLLILFRSMKAYIRKQQHPNAIVPIRLGGNVVNSDAVYAILQFVITYIVAVFIGAGALSLLGTDMETSFSASVACMGNIGPGFGDISSFGNYSDIHFAGKFLLSFQMLFGRLEMYGLLLFLFVKSWR
jgi:trk system potassium uptake protein TrkH